MYRVLIVEDDNDQAQIVHDMVIGSPWGRELSVEHVTDVPSLEACLADGTPVDIVMMDIELGSADTNGIDVVKRRFPAGCGTQVIYVTGFIEHCTSVYRTEHVYFLAKPIAQEDMDDALRCAIERAKAASAKPLPVRFGSRVVLVDPRKILCVESDRRKVLIHTDQEALEEYASLGDLMKELPSSFVQCHKSFLVNLDHVVELRKDAVVLDSGRTIPVSQKKRGPVREALFARLQSKL